MVFLRRAGIALVVAWSHAGAPGQVCPYESPSLASEDAAEVAWAARASLQGGDQGLEVERLRKALGHWRGVESDAGRQVVVHLLVRLDARGAKVSAAELEFQGHDLARIARVPLLARGGDAGVLFREFRATPSTEPAWELLGDALVKLEHPAFVAELFTSWRPVLRVVVTEASLLRQEGDRQPTMRPDPEEYVEIEGMPRLPRLTWRRGGARGEVCLMRGYVATGVDATTLVLTEDDVEFARCRWLGILHRHSFPSAFARSFVVVAHQRDHFRFADRVAEARAGAEKSMRELAAELVARKLLTASRAVPPKLSVVVKDERSEGTRKQYPLPKVD